jgi:hypothetical protein
MPLHILIITTLGALLQVAALMLLIRGLLWVLGMRTNVIYGVFTAGSMPFMRLTRRIAPRAVPDTYIPALAFVLVFAASIALLVAQQSLCAERADRCVQSGAAT